MTKPTTQALAELRRLAEAAKGWRNVNIVKASSDDDTAVIGAEVDGEFYPCVDVDCDQYYQDSKPFADYLAAMNTHGIELLDAIEAQTREIAELKRPKEKIAPVQGWPQGIPWSLHLEAYAVYSKKWAPQPALIDLEGRNCRGGFGVGELDEFIPGWRERVSELAVVKAERDTLKAELAAIRAQKPVGCGYVVKWEKGDTASTYETGHAQILGVPVYASPVADVNSGLVELVASGKSMREAFGQLLDATGIDESTCFNFKNGDGEVLASVSLESIFTRWTNALSTARTQQAQKGGE